MVTTKDDPEDPRQEFCRRLRLLGVTASPAGHTIRQNVNEYIGKYVVDVTENPIRQILIREERHNPGGDVRLSARREIKYLIPDPRIKPGFPKKGAHSTRVRRFLGVFGPVVGLRWENVWGKETIWNEIANRLNLDDSLIETQLRGEIGLTISVDPNNSYWELTEGAWEDEEGLFSVIPKLVDVIAEHTPSRLRWDCYESVAQHLLATPPFPDKRLQLLELGIDALALDRDPFTTESITYGGYNWIEIAEGSIRWVGVPSQDDRPYEFYAPDSRIGAKFPQVAARSERFVMRSFPIFGRVTSSGLRWVLCDLHSDTNEEFSSIITGHLNQDSDLTEKIASSEEDFHILSDPDRKCWVMSKGSYLHFDDDDMKVTTPIWECYRQIAEALLAMPIPTDK